MEISKETREKIDRLKYKRVIKNHNNRKTLTEMFMQSKLYSINYYIGQLMQGQMMQSSVIKNAVNNLIVEADNLKKKATKI